MDELGSVDVLLADDADADAEMIERALRRGSALAKVLRVRDGVEALEYIFGEGSFARRPRAQPRLIILDLKMPRLGGIDVLRRLKEGRETKAIPVVMLTSSAEDRDILESYQLGASSYLVKPVDSTAFTALVAHAATYWVMLNRLPAHGERIGGNA